MKEMVYLLWVKKNVSNLMRKVMEFVTLPSLCIVKESNCFYLNGKRLLISRLIDLTLRNLCRLKWGKIIIPVEGTAGLGYRFIMVYQKQLTGSISAWTAAVATKFYTPPALELETYKDKKDYDRLLYMQGRLETWGKNCLGLQYT